MNSTINTVIIAFCIVFIAPIVYADYPINELPLYGGIKKTQQQIKSDKEFISTIIQSVGSRIKGSKKIVNLGWKYYYKGDYSTAITKF